MNNPARQPKPSILRAWTGVYVLVVCLVLGHHTANAEDLQSIIGNITASAGGEDHDHDHPPGAAGGGKKGGGSAPKANPVLRPESAGGRPHSEDVRPRADGGEGRGGEDACAVNPSRLTDFANGQGYDFRSVVTYLTAPQCQAAARGIQKEAANGVNFSSTPPFRFDNFAKALPQNDLESSKRLDTQLSGVVPQLMREKPLSPNEMLPLLGQLTILSPGAARWTLGALIEQELYAGDANLASAGRAARDGIAVDVAKTLMKLGAGEGPIASELAKSVEEKAGLAQADSLGKIFRALAAAASVEAALVPTYNLTAASYNRGVQKSKLLVVAGDRNLLLVSTFSAIKSALAGSAALEPGATELNDAMSALMNGSSLTETSLKKLWSEAVRVLASSTSQNALAEAVALSLTPEMIFLSPEKMEQLLACSRNYPEIAGGVQSNFLLAWNKIWDNLHDGKIKPKNFNRLREKYFEPLVAQILELDPYLIDPFWLREVQRRGMIADEEVEKKFPRFVLAFLDRRDKATKLAANEAGLEPTMSAMAENFAVVWTLSNVHVPALMKWVKKYEQ